MRMHININFPAQLLSGLALITKVPAHHHRKKKIGENSTLERNSNYKSKGKAIVNFLKGEMEVNDPNPKFKFWVKKKRL